MSVIPSWLQYISTSNTISNTYIQGFLDISQNLIVRNYPVTIVNGNVVLNGNIYCGNLINTNSISINGITAQNVMVNSDVSLNGNITVNNNIYSYNTNNKIVLTVSRDTSLNLQLINTALSSNKTLSSTQILNKINIFSNLGYTATIGIGNITTQPTILTQNLVIGGNSTLKSNTTGTSNIAFGSSALTSNTIGLSNVAIGQNALYYNIGNSLNVVIGCQKYIETNSTNRCIFIGQNQNIRPPNNGIVIGYQASVKNYSNPIAIGYNSNSTYNDIIALGTTNETVYIAGRVTNNFVSTTSNYKFTTNGISYIGGNISAQNMYVNGGTNIYTRLNNINNGFTINATYNGNYITAVNSTGDGFFSLNGQPQSDISASYITVNLPFYVYYGYASCKTSPISDINGPSVIISNNNTPVQSMIFATGQLTNSISIPNSITNSRFITGNKLSVTFNTTASSGSGGTLWKATYLCKWF